MSIKISKAEVLAVLKDAKVVVALVIALVAACADLILALPAPWNGIVHVVSVIAPAIAFWVAPSPKDKAIAAKVEQVAVAVVAAKK